MKSRTPIEPNSSTADPGFDRILYRRSVLAWIAWIACLFAGQMDAILLQKVEELTLHVIRQQEDIAELRGALQKTDLDQPQG